MELTADRRVRRHHLDRAVEGHAHGGGHGERLRRRRRVDDVEPLPDGAAGEIPEYLALAVLALAALGDQKRAEVLDAVGVQVEVLHELLDGQRVRRILISEALRELDLMIEQQGPLVSQEHAFVALLVNDFKAVLFRVSTVVVTHMDHHEGVGVVQHVHGPLL